MIRLILSSICACLWAGMSGAATVEGAAFISLGAVAPAIGARHAGAGIATIEGQRGTLTARTGTNDATDSGLAGSLFRGEAGSGFFRPLPRRERKGAAAGRIARLLDLIAEAEAGPAGYNAVQYGAVIRPPDLPSRMTIAQINAWIEATPGQPHAIGRYQFIPATLRRLVRKAGLSPTATFGPRVQDRLAHELLAEAGIGAFGRGEITREVFMLNLAKIWAGLPTASGKSYYHGYAGNAATMTWARYAATMAEIFAGSDKGGAPIRSDTVTRQNQVLVSGTVRRQDRRRDETSAVVRLPRSGAGLTGRAK